MSLHCKVNHRPITSRRRSRKRSMGEIRRFGFILSVVRDGYKIPFVTLPPPKVIPNNHSAVTHNHFVSEAISDLLRTKCVEILDHKPDIVNPLSAYQGFISVTERRVSKLKE